MGFKEVEKAFKHLCIKAEPVEEKEKETSIPAGYEEGMRLFPVKVDKTTHYTSPPKSLKNWFLPVMHRERVSRYYQVPRERNW